MNDSALHQEKLSLATEIVASFVGNNSVAMADLPVLIGNVFEALRTAEQIEARKPADAPTPAVPISDSVGPDFIICLEDGKKFKILKRHLATQYQMTPADYRRRWGLAGNYPMVAPAYAAQRSKLAKQFGLGRKPAAASEPAAAAKGPRRASAGR